MVLTAERWAHICDGHPELGPHLADVLAAVREAEHVMPGRRPGEEWFYAEGVGPSRWLKIVISFPDGEPGRIITSFGRRRKP